MHKHVEKISNHVKLILYQRPCNTESIVMFGMKIVSISSKHYHPPGNPGINLQNLANPGHLCKFSCQMPSPQTSLRALIFKTFYTFPPLSRSRSLEYLQISMVNIYLLIENM